MLSLKNRLYFSTLINSFGSWLTFLAIALVVKEKYGANQVAFVFLIQTLPAIIFSRSLSQMIPVHMHERVYWITQVLLAACSFSLCFDQSLTAIYIQLFISALLKSVSNPLFNTLIGKWIPEEEQKEVFTRVGALQAGTLALAPIIGAWVKIVFSAKVLFALDALTFILSIIVLKELFVHVKPAVQKWVISWKSLLAGISPRPKDIPLSIQKTLLPWFIYLGVGALLNAIEFSAFEKVQMKEQQIGYAMAAWGLGNLFSFIKKNSWKNQNVHMAHLVSLSLFVFASHYSLIIASFFLAGIFSSYVAGTLRTAVQQSVPAGYNAMPVWAYANQITQFINLIAYTASSFLLAHLGFYAFGLAMIALATFIWIQSLKRSSQSLQELN